MSFTDVSFEGFKELDAALADLPKATQRNTLRRVLKLAAAPVERAMAANAPRRTGDLSDDVETGTKLTGRQARMVRKDGKDFAEVYVGTVDPAGVLQEYGTFSNTAQPWARPAWEGTQAMALATVKTELRSEIEKARARLAKKAARIAAAGG